MEELTVKNTRCEIEGPINVRKLHLVNSSIPKLNEALLETTALTTAYNNLTKFKNLQSVVELDLQLKFLFQDELRLTDLPILCSLRIYSKTHYSLSL